MQQVNFVIGTADRQQLAVGREIEGLQRRLCKLSTTRLGIRDGIPNLHMTSAIARGQYGRFRLKRAAGNLAWQFDVRNGRGFAGGPHAHLVAFGNGDELAVVGQCDNGWVGVEFPLAEQFAAFGVL